VIGRAVLVLVFAIDAGCQRPSEHSLHVLAASSLRESFTSLGAAFEREHPGVHVAVTFAGSQELRFQIEHGARADVFASADEKHINALAGAGLVEAPHVFARNTLCIAVSDSATAVVRSLADLPRAEHIVLGAHEVPVGAYAELLLDRASRKFGADFRERVEHHVVSRELNTRQVLAKVTLGEADAAIVYRSDLAAAGAKAHAVRIPPELDVVAAYPVAVLRGAPEHTLGEQWVAFLTSSEGQRSIVASGLLPAEP
jgi:molybdate transport system substrate-binding protein